MRKHHNRLFFGKYTHKAVFKMPWATWLYPTTDEHLSILLHGGKDQYKGKIYLDRFVEASKHMLKIRSLAYVILRHRTKMKFRIQDKKVIIYGNKTLVHDMISSYWDEWIDCFETTKNFDSKMDKNTVICSRLPHKKYQYQVWLKPAMYHSDSKEAKSLKAYLLDKPDVGRPANTMQKNWLKGESDYDGSGYFYITDEKCLTPVHMIMGESIDKIIKFVKI
jgi:hypothetical protein